MTRFVGRTIPVASASRKSRTALPALSEPVAPAARWAGRVLLLAACDARLRARCWRPRASPPFFAAARRLAAELLEVEERERAEELERLDERPELDRPEVERLDERPEAERPEDLLELDLRDAALERPREPPDDPRALDPLRPLELDLPPPLRRDEPPLP